MATKKTTKSPAPKKRQDKTAPTKQMRPQTVVHAKYLSNGQPRPKKRG